MVHLHLSTCVHVQLIIPSPGFSLCVCYQYHYLKLVCEYSELVIQGNPRGVPELPEPVEEDWDSSFNLQMLR